VIVLHRLGHDAEEFLLNPDLILTVEANPDTVVTLTSGVKVLVSESPARVAREVRAWRSGILADALHGEPVPRAVRPPLTAIEGTSARVDHLG
jgi:flagellar protein FlbD